MFLDPQRPHHYSLTTEIERLANAVWYRSKAKLKSALASKGPDTPTDSRKSCMLPPEIVEMIIVYFEYDIATLRACAATCSSWYNVATPYLHYALSLRTSCVDKSRRYPNLFASVHKLGLLPLVKRLRFEEDPFGVPWVTPDTLNYRSMRHLHALVNLQDLIIANLDLSEFPVGAGDYFGHFSPTLRSVALSCPRGTRRQLLDFLRLFPMLDHISISNYDVRTQAHEALDPRQVLPIKGGLRGRLILENFGGERLLKDVIVAFGGMRFAFIDLQNTRGAQLLLEACADTLETVRIYTDANFRYCKRVLVPYDGFPTS